MWKTIRKKPRSLVIAQGLAIVGFLALAGITFVQDNLLISPLFLLLAFYYIKKLLKSPSSYFAGNRAAVQVEAVVDKKAVKEELTAMQAYYRRLQKSWCWIAGLGWIFTVFTAVISPSFFLVIIAGLAGYASYAYVRCRQAVRLIKTGLNNEGRLKGELCKSNN